MPGEPFELSVVIPTFGRPNGVTQLVRQLNEQTLSPDAYEVIVIDDGSPVDVRNLLKSSDYRFSLVVERQPNGGSAAARQRGADRATGTTVLFVDDDVNVGPEFLQ